VVDDGGKGGGSKRRRRTALLLALALLSLATSLVGSSCESSTPRRPALVVEVSQRQGKLRPIWDEVNLWKLESWFGVHRGDPADEWGDGWLRKHAPWLRYARVVAALGGNYAPEIADACDHGRVAREHPEVIWECGRDGNPGPSAQNEIARRIDGAWRFDYRPFRTALERVLRSGVLPHLNLSSSPSAFTGGSVDFLHYHWNAAPVTDLDGWVGFVRGAFEGVGELRPEGWRVSIVNEPNCLILDAQGVVRNVGFAAGAEPYSRLWTKTAAALREVAPGVELHPGNYVTSATFPGEDNLGEYLGALATALPRHPELAWKDLPYVSLSLYEVRDTELFDFRSTRLARLRSAQVQSGLPPLPIKVDELGIHRDLRLPFEERTGTPLRTTLFAASWHGEALRSFLDAGDVVSVSPWLEHLFVVPQWQPLPTAQVYWLLGMLVGQLRLVTTSTGEPSVEGTGDDRGRDRLVVREEPGDTAPGERASEPAEPNEPAPRSSLEALATADGDTVRVFIVHHQNELVRDDDSVRARLTRRVDLRLEGVPDGAWGIRHLSIGAPGGAIWNGERSTPFQWQPDGCVESEDGAVVAASSFELPANSVYLFEVLPHERCP
jgi:hypothetical protein